MTAVPGERLQKVLARAGVASRRAAERLITAGRVTVNGRKVTALGSRVEPEDEVRVDGKAVRLEEPVYYLLHKPRGVVTTMSDPEGRDHVGELARRVRERVFPVGRLDYDAEGLLLLTNDGELANRLAHPRYEVPRTYEAKVKGTPDAATLDQLRSGVRLEDGLALPEEVTVLRPTRANTWIRVVVREGRPHLVKRLFAAVGHPVQRLRRVAFAGVELGGLAAGELRPLRRGELAELQAHVVGGEAGSRKKTRRPGKGGRS